MSAASITAYVVIGVVEPEGFCPRNWAYLVEGERLEWFIAPPGFYSGPDSPMFKSNWLTTAKTVVEDLMLGVATVVEELPGVSEEITKVADYDDGETIDLDRLTADCRARLNRINQATKHNVHLVVTVLSGSLLSKQVEKFRQYNVAAEICTSSYVQAGRAHCMRFNGKRPSSFGPN